MPGRLAGKTALITGAGRNIGRATAVAFAREGANVAINVRSNVTEAEEAAAECRAYGVRAISIAADVADRAAVNLMVRQVRAEFGGIDILVNNAAGPRLHKAFLEITDEDWRRAQGVVLDGTFYCCQAAIPLMIERGGGAIINVSGASIFRGQSHRANFMAAKSGLLGLTRALALEFGEHGIRVNCLVPDWIETSRMPGQQHYADAKGMEVPLRRRGVPEDCADVALFLVSEDSRFVTGQTIHVNGGTVLS